MANPLSLLVIIKAITLGLIEGLTEFIPVSSTAHLLLASKFLDFSYIKNGVFEISIQLGAILAVCFLYKKKIFDLVFKFHKDKQTRDFGINIVIAFVPAVVFGFLLHNIIKTVLFSPKVIAFALIFGGIAIIWVEKFMNIKPKYDDINKLSQLQSLYIGIFQCLAIIPGISRSGATIIGGLLLKLNRRISTEFSFFLAIPTIFGAVAFDLYKNLSALTWSNFEVIIIGFITAFLSSLIVIKWFINFVSRNDFLIFAYYRIVIGILVLILIF